MAVEVSASPRPLASRRIIVGREDVADVRLNVQASGRNAKPRLSGGVCRSTE